MHRLWQVNKIIVRYETLQLFKKESWTVLSQNIFMLYKRYILLIKQAGAGTKPWFEWQVAYFGYAL
jgi:hypothetical protein